MAPSNGTNGTNGTARGMTAAQELRHLLFESKDIIVAPGVFDGLSARTALEVGFDCLYMVSLFTESVRSTHDLTVA